MRDAGHNQLSHRDDATDPRAQRANMSVSADEREAPHAGSDVFARDAWALASSVANDGLWYFDVAAQQLHFSARAMELLGYPRREGMPTPAQVRQHIELCDVVAVERAAADLLRGDRSRVDLELRVRSVGGETRWVQARARAQRDAAGERRVIGGSLADIDARKRAELALREGARSDALTGLPNRTTLAQRLTARVARAALSPQPRFAVLYLDLDHFKVVNDSLGHTTGDMVLLEACARIRSTLGEKDCLARMGGDEFVVLQDEVGDERDSQQLADAIHEAIRPAMQLGGRELFSTASIGVRVSDDAPVKASDLLRDADVAMYQAKRRGGARWVMFDQRMHRDMVERLRVQTDLHHALHREELRLAYQPMFDLAERRLCGFEALLRWQHPTRGRLIARDFVGEANDTGLIVHIGRWVLREVCSQLAEWRREYPNAAPLSVAVNLCDREILDPDFVSTVESALAMHGVPACCLTLEMTEGVMTTNAEFAIPALRRLRDQGVNIQMEGFGRGSSSLTVLRRMPLSAIKIDRSFITGVDTDEESRAIVATISAFARALGLEVIAEGIETREQAAALAELGPFRYVQGHHFGPPSDHTEAAELLEEI